VCEHVLKDTLKQPPNLCYLTNGKTNRFLFYKKMLGFIKQIEHIQV